MHSWTRICKWCSSGAPFSYMQEDDQPLFRQAKAMRSRQGQHIASTSSECCNLKKGVHLVDASEYTQYMYRYNSKC